MENLVDALEVFRGRKVFITGDTGFKGSWLSLWLHQHGAQVFGYALPPEDNSHFDALGLSEIIQHRDGDIRDYKSLSTFINEVDPDIIFHLAAQALVIKSYQDPKETFDTNVVGGINLLEAVRHHHGLKALVFITSDKCYLNKEVTRGYTELDELGGYDPYSASKAAAELVFASYAKSYFAHRPSFGAASARAGNVIGGGDWSTDRIIPDCIRSLTAQTPIEVRNPDATRPWQHVLEPLSGYLRLAELLYADGPAYAEAWNFGPYDEDVQPVQWLADYVCRRWASATATVVSGVQPHEAKYLKLDCSKARARLGWRPHWRLSDALDRVLEWTRDYQQHADVRATCLRQIAEYLAASE